MVIGLLGNLTSAARLDKQKKGKTAITDSEHSRSFYFFDSLTFFPPSFDALTNDKNLSRGLDDRDEGSSL